MHDLDPEAAYDSDMIKDPSKKFPMKVMDEADFQGLNEKQMQEYIDSTAEKQKVIWVDGKPILVPEGVEIESPSGEPPPFMKEDRTICATEAYEMAKANDEFRKDIERQEREALRDQFAMHAPIAAFLAKDWMPTPESIERNAEFAYRWADAMLKEREKK